MTDKAENPQEAEPNDGLVAFPLPTPTTGGSADNNPRMLKMVQGGPPNPIEMLEQAAMAHTNFYKIADLRITPAVAKQLSEIMTVQAQAMSDALAAVPQPANSALPDTGPDQVFLPYLLIGAMHMLFTGFTPVLSQMSVPERYAFISEFVRAQCLYGAITHGHENGVNDSQTKAIPGVAAMMEPVPAPPIAMMVQVNRLKEEGKLTEVAETLAQKLKEIGNKEETKPEGRPKFKF